MTELKTLKDLRTLPLIQSPIPSDFISRTELKAEAIKWVKFWYDEMGRHICPSKLTCQVCLKLQGKIEAIMELNNITEEDLI